MSDPLNALQAGIYGRLTTFAGLTALVSTRIHDFVPPSATPPFVVIGDDTATDSDTKTSHGWEFTITIHCWDFEKAGRKSVKAVMQQIWEALHDCENAVNVAGSTLVYLRCEKQESFQDQAIEGENDHFYHGIQRFRALVTEN
jgi:hypothetical protein